MVVDHGREQTTITNDLVEAWFHSLVGLATIDGHHLLQPASRPVLNNDQHRDSVTAHPGMFPKIAERHVCFQDFSNHVELMRSFLPKGNTYCMSGPEMQLHRNAQPESVMLGTANLP